MSWKEPPDKGEWLLGLGWFAIVVTVLILVLL